MPSSLQLVSDAVLSILWILFALSPFFIPLVSCAESNGRTYIDDERDVCKEMGANLRVEAVYQQVPWARNVCVLRSESGHMTVVSF